MRTLIQKLAFSALATQKYPHTKFFPDNKWITVKGIKVLGYWWGKGMEHLDNRCALIVPPPEPDGYEYFRMVDKVVNELRPEMMKYRAMCTIRFTRDATRDIEFGSLNVGEKISSYLERAFSKTSSSEK